jgi:hypothetical protein
VRSTASFPPKGLRARADLVVSWNWSSRSHAELVTGPSHREDQANAPSTLIARQIRLHADLARGSLGFTRLSKVPETTVIVRRKGVRKAQAVGDPSSSATKLSASDRFSLDHTNVNAYASRGELANVVKAQRWSIFDVITANDREARVKAFRQPQAMKNVPESRSKNKAG